MTAPKKPQDRKPKATETTDSRPAGVVVVELDGHQVEADFSHYRNLRLMRRMKRGDMSATIEMIELVFGDNLDEYEDRFDLTTDEDWNDFIIRVAEAANPNS